MAHPTKDAQQELVGLSDLPDRLGRPSEALQSLDIGILTVLSRMTSAERISASRHGGFTRHERAIWAARYPEEVPIVNGEFEWIAAGLADLD